MGTLRQFIAEARRRRVFRTAGLYIVGAWILIQAVSLALPALELDASLISFAWAAALAGFPLALIFGWYFDVTANGIRRAATLPDRPADPALRLTDFVLIGALAIVAGIVTAGILDRAREAGAVAGFESFGIAVLPLADLSGDGAEPYFSAGMQDALITSLSGIGSLRVVSRRSASRIDGNLPIGDIGRLLGVRNLVEGSVVRDGSRVRVIVQLVDAVRDAQIWAGSFEREMTGALGLQNEIAASIANAIAARLSTEEERRLARQPEMKAESYDRYLRAMHLVNSDSNLERRKGIAMLEETAENDPDNALVHAGLAYGYALLGHSPFPEGMYPASRLAAERALRLDDSLAEAHLAVGMLKMYYEWDFKAAENALRHALELNPSLPLAQYQFAWLMELLGDDDQALRAGEETIRLEPLDPFMRGWLADQYRDAGRLEDALRVADETLELEEDHAVAIRVRALVLAELGRFGEALAASSRIADHPLWGFVHGVVLAKAGRIDEARAVLDGIEPAPQNAIPLLRLHATLGDREEVLHWLVIARDVRLPWYPWMLHWFPDMPEYADDPKVRELAAGIGLSDIIARR